MDQWRAKWADKWGEVAGAYDQWGARWADARAAAVGDVNRRAAEARRRILRSIVRQSMPSDIVNLIAHHRPPRRPRPAPPRLSRRGRQLFCLLKRGPASAPSALFSAVEELEVITFKEHALDTVEKERRALLADGYEAPVGLLHFLGGRMDHVAPRVKKLAVHFGPPVALSSGRWKFRPGCRWRWYAPTGKEAGRHARVLGIIDLLAVGCPGLEAIRTRRWLDPAEDGRRTEFLTSAYSGSSVGVVEAEDYTGRACSPSASWPLLLSHPGKSAFWESNALPEMAEEGVEEAHDGLPPWGDCSATGEAPPVCPATGCAPGHDRGGAVSGAFFCSARGRAFWLRHGGGSSFSFTAAPALDPTSATIEQNPGGECVPARSDPNICLNGCTADKPNRADPRCPTRCSRFPGGKCDSGCPPEAPYLTACGCEPGPAAAPGMCMDGCAPGFRRNHPGCTGVPGALVGECVPDNQYVSYRTCLNGCTSDAPFRNECGQCDRTPDRRKDDCGVCGGNNRNKNICGNCFRDGLECTSPGCTLGQKRNFFCEHCVPHGDAETFMFPVCPGTGCPPGQTKDRCGVCGGADECVGCNGVPNSGWKLNACAECVPPSASSIVCKNGCEAGQSKDDCGNCSEKPLPKDTCGVCGGDNSSCTDRVCLAKKKYGMDSGYCNVYKTTQLGQGKDPIIFLDDAIDSMRDLQHGLVDILQMRPPKDVTVEVSPALARRAIGEIVVRAYKLHPVLFDAGRSTLQPHMQYAGDVSREPVAPLVISTLTRKGLKMLPETGFAFGSFYAFEGTVFAMPHFQCAFQWWEGLVLDLDDRAMNGRFIGYRFLFHQRPAASYKDNGSKFDFIAEGESESEDEEEATCPASLPPPPPAPASSSRSGLRERSAAPPAPPPRPRPTPSPPETPSVPPTEVLASVVAPVTPSVPPSVVAPVTFRAPPTCAAPATPSPPDVRTEPVVELVAAPVLVHTRSPPT
eukprot:tig00000492_g1419.t1